MEIPEFIEETSKIENFFEKELTKFQRDEWYKELKNIPVNRYRQIIKQVFRKCKFMPKLADVVSIQEELPYEKSSINEIEKVFCKKCKGLGFIIYTKIIDNGDKKLEYNYLARCNCTNGLRFAYDGSQISDTEHRSKFYVAIAQQLGL